jgi:Viral BACON domain
MYQCEYCGSALPDHAHFCGNCGQVSSDQSKWPTQGNGLPAVNFDTRDALTALSASNIPPSLSNVDLVQENSALTIPDFVTVPLDEGIADDEEKKRRAAMIGFGLPFLGNQSLANHVPMAQGAPQPAQVPFVQGTPQALQEPSSAAGHVLEGPHLGAAPHSTLSAQPPISPHVSHPTTPLHLLHSSSHPGHSHHQQHPVSPHHHRTHGHARHRVVAAIVAPIIIIVTVIGAGFTVWAPVLSLSGGTDVVQGGTLHLHGSNFIPGSSVTLTLDGTTPLYYTHQHSLIQIQALHAPRSIDASAMIPTHDGLSFSLLSNTIKVAGNGTFNALIPIDLSWHLGRHTIRASEAITQRSTELAFTIYLPGTLPTPAPSGTASLSPTAHPKTAPTLSPSPTDSPFPKGSPTPTATSSTGSPTPTSTLAGLSCVNPSSVSLGPVSEGYNQPASAAVTLCTKGSGTVSWNATWDTNSASWLQLDASSGQIQAPGQAQINVRALATQLNPGNYTASVTFRSQPNNSTITLNVTFTVQAGCINAAPQTLNFTGVAGMSDPPTQSVTIGNCGAVGTWSESTVMDNGANWLSINSTGNTLNGGATSNLTVTASNLNANLPPGTYSGKLLFRLGSASSTVSVTLTVQAPPTLAVNPGSIYANQQCSSSQAGAWVCYVSLTNNSNNLSLSWSASSTGVPGISFKPSSDTIAPGQTERVEIIVPYNNCQTSTSLIFTGPANTVNVPWTCTVIG